MSGETVVWNNSSATPPEMTFHQSSCCSNEIIQVLRNAVCKELEADVKRKKLCLEGKLLSYFSYKLGHKYRSDKGFKALEKVKKVVKALRALDIQTVLRIIEIRVANNDVPTKNVIKWLLVRLQTYAKLLHRATLCCSKSGQLLFYRLLTGHSWREIVTVFAIVSRVMCYSTNLLKGAVDTYNTLLPVVQYLPKGQDKEFLPENYTLPDNLWTWVHQMPTLSNVEIISPQISEIVQHDINIPILQEDVLSFKVVNKFFRSEKNKRKEKTECYTAKLSTGQWNEFKNRAFELAKKVDNVRSAKCKRILTKELKSLVVEKLF